MPVICSKAAPDCLGKCHHAKDHEPDKTCSEICEDEPESKCKNRRSFKWSKEEFWNRIGEEMNCDLCPAKPEDKPQCKGINCGQSLRDFYEKEFKPKESKKCVYCGDLIFESKEKTCKICGRGVLCENCFNFHQRQYH